MTSSPVAWVIVSLVTLLIGGGSGGAIVALRRDRRQGNRDDLDLFDAMRKLAAAEVRAAYERIAQLEERDRQREREQRRAHAHINQLETVIRGMGGLVPPWPAITD